jgi:hypothetical protein
MAKSINEVINNVRHDVIFTLNELKENPELAAEWSEVGDKGIPFAWYNNELFELPKPEEIRVWGREVKINKKSYKMLFTCLISDHQGAVEVPISIFRRIPALPEEIAVLKEGNEIGMPLLNQMPDLKRFELLVSLVGNQTVQVTSVTLHRNGWDADNNKPILDSADKEEKDRHQLVCYRYNLVA